MRTVEIPREAWRGRRGDGHHRSPVIVHLNDVAELLGPSSRGGRRLLPAHTLRFTHRPSSSSKHRTTRTSGTSPPHP